MSITFSEIPNILKVPGVYQEIDSSLAGSSQSQTSVVIFAQKLPVGTGPALQVQQIDSAAQAKELYGKGSQLALMLENFKANNQQQVLYAVALDDDGAAVQAAGNYTITGTATKAGTLTIYINGVAIKTAVAEGDTGEDVALALQAAIASNVDLPIEAVIDTGVTDEQVDITALNGGEVGNDIPLFINLFGEETPAGLTVTITQLTGGTTNPNMAGAILALEEIRYNWFVMPYNDTANLILLETELDSRYEALRQLGGRAFLAKRGDLATVRAFGQSRNNPHLCCIDAGQNPHSGFVWATTHAAVLAPFITADPAQPLNTKKLTGLLPVSSRSLSDRDDLLNNGIATHTVASDGSVYTERAVTTYTETPQAEATTAYLDMQVPETLDAMRAIRRAEIQRVYNGYKLAGTVGETYGAGQKVLTIESMTGFLLSLYKDTFLREKGWVQDYEHYKATLVVVINTQDKTRIDWQEEPTLIGQFYIGAGKIQFK